MKGSVHFKSDRRQWVVAWSWQGRRYQISRYKGRLMVQTHPDQRKDQGYIDACRLLAQMQGEVENGVFRIEKYTGNRYTDVIPFFEQWLSTKSEGKKPGTIRLYRSLFNNHLKPFFESHPVQLHEIQLDTLDSLMSSIRLSKSSKHLCMMIFRAFLDYAWRSKRIPEMPPFPKKCEYGIEEPKIKWLPESRQMAIINTIPEKHRAIFLFLKYHVRRPSEAMALQKIDYDRFNKAFHIRRGVSGGKLVTSTKTMAEHIVPCHRAMIADIERLVDADNGSPFLFVNRGRRYTEGVLNRLWKKACAACGEDIGLYAGLKHSSMSQFVNEKRLGLADVQLISQHAKIESVYKYVSVDLDRARELIESGVSEMFPVRKRGAK
jgi:integrase